MYKHLSYAKKFEYVCLSMCHVQNPFVQIRRYEHLLCAKNISPNTYV